MTPTDCQQMSRNAFNLYRAFKRAAVGAPAWRNALAPRWLILHWTAACRRWTRAARTTDSGALWVYSPFIISIFPAALPTAAASLLSMNCPAFLCGAPSASAGGLRISGVHMVQHGRDS